MQTFLPYADYARSARALDRARLGKQRVEAYQILRVLLSITKGWANHPAVRMWRGHERSLAHYTLAMCDEWKRRGYNDTVSGKVLELLKLLPVPSETYAQEIAEAISTVSAPQHFTAEFRLSHQSNLVRKNPAYYAPQFPGVPDNLPYVWPR